ncbi:MAG TPA: thioredoxin [Dermatophilaceae bacterium]|jgi:thioredoxin 1|nr:thioredoxin [Actinomycetales bacterium]HMT32320.1 thioredoxin [Dermatophilaceae bacterium]HMT89963.1 thioredoxin [Dermatophilaceae bacterium]
MGAIPATTDATFDQDVLASSKPVLVDFWAAWCGPCKQIAPILEEIYAEHGDKLEIRKLDSDANPKSTMRFGVTGLPTLNLYVNGEVVKSIVGAKPKRIILKELEDFLG